MGDITDKYAPLGKDETVAGLKAENKRLRAFAQYVVDMDPDNPAPLFAKARAALAG